MRNIKLTLYLLILHKLSLVSNFLKEIWSGFFIDPKSQLFINYNKRRWKDAKSRNNKGEILVEIYDVDQTVLAFSYVTNILARKHNSKIVSFLILNRHPFLIFLRYRRIFEIYKSFNVFLHVNLRLNNKSLMNRTLLITNNILKKIESTNDILVISVNGIVIGADIYESFLRDNKVPTIDIHSFKFKRYLTKSIAIFLFWDQYFKSHNVKSVVLSHGIYRYGFVKKIANMQGIPVYLPTVRSLYCLKNEKQTGLPPFRSYSIIFSKLTKKEQLSALSWSEKRLKLRFSGKVAVDMHYSSKSAFVYNARQNKALKQNNRIKILIATHCFFDNPHCYGINLFPDFYEWLNFLGEMSEVTDYDWYIKTHPDVLPGNKEVLNRILEKYKKITLLNEDVSHLQLKEEGISFVLTVYGSVGHEYPLLGNVVINAGKNNPHAGYNFNIHCNSISEYRDLILNLVNLKLNFNKRDVYEFYYMHYKYFGPLNLFFDSFDDFCKNCLQKQISSYVYSYFFNEHNEIKDHILCSKIEKFINSNKYTYTNMGLY